MIYETNEKHFSVFKEECIKWIKFFGITEWEIFFVHETYEDGCRAACYTKHLHKIAHLALNKRQEVCEPITDESIKKSAFHEVCELLLSSITFIALDEEIPHHERQGLTESETHEVIRRMENSIFNHVKLEA
ncbi:MAG: hypothetical protein KH421_10135 [Akkermansia muciniphila]|jgi:hypothetical protein|nr:hypothetical protein [Akkermansia muciniphila]